MTAIEWITKEAKKLRKDYPKRFKTWREYVSQASAIYKSKSKPGLSKVKKKIGAIKIVEKGESKNAKPKATYEFSRTKKGTYKSVKKIAGAKPSTHKDNKSHNVNIRVVSGVYKFTPNELNFLQTEHKKSKGYKYRAKILFGQPIVLKETENGTPVQKWIVQDLQIANLLAKELNKKHKLGSIKTKIL